MAAAVGVERAEQPLRRDRLLHPLKAAHRALLLDEKGRGDLAGRVVQRADQVVLPLVARQPGEARAILVQHHPGQRLARPLPAMRRPLLRRPHQPGSVQHALGPAVARCEPVLALRPLVEVLHRPAGVAVAVKRDDPLDLVGSDPVRAHLAQPPVEQPVGALRLIAPAQSPKRPLRTAQQIRRIHRAQTPPREPAVNILKAHSPYLVQCFRPSHPRPLSPDGSKPDRSPATKAGQITCYRHASRQRLASARPLD